MTIITIHRLFDRGLIEDAKERCVFWVRYHGDYGVSMLMHIIRHIMLRVKMRDETIQDCTRRDVKERKGEKTCIAGDVLLGY